MTASYMATRLKSLDCSKQEVVGATAALWKHFESSPLTSGRIMWCKVTFLEIINQLCLRNADNSIVLVTMGNSPNSMSKISHKLTMTEEYLASSANISSLTHTHAGIHSRNNDSLRKEVWTWLHIFMQSCHHFGFWPLTEERREEHSLM